MKKIIVIFLCLFSPLVFSNTQPFWHLEPANWWVGMKWNQVELMVHGSSIANTNPAVNYSGVSILEIAKTDNPNYLFVTLKIDEKAKPGKFPIQFFRDQQLVASFTYELWTREKNSAERQGFSTQDAIYLLTPDRFANGNLNNDNQPDMLEKVNRKDKNGRHGGDLQGMQQQLGYIAAMGFTQIWPNPLLENNQPQYSYHGYAATNLYRIDPRFGTNEDYRNFVKLAKAKNIGVIQDIILNHIGSGHWWMKDLPAKNWLNFPDQYVETSHRRTSILDPHAAAEDKEKFVAGWFVPTMPDLNQQHPQLANYLIQNSLWWIEYAGLSGIREDTFGYADEKFLARWAQAILQEYPKINLVGEEWSNNPAIVAHWQKMGMPSMMDFPIYETLRQSLLEDESFTNGWIKLYEALANDFLYPAPDNLVVFAENHDTSRLYSLLNEDLDLYKMAMVYLATVRGIPQFYAGGEILMTSPRERDDGAVRADIPGGWPQDNKSMFSGKGLSAKQQDAQKFIKQLFNWRKSAEAIHSGKLEHFAPENGIYVYFRYTENSMVMVVLNKNHQDITLDLKRFSRVIGNKESAKDLFSGIMISKDRKVNLRGRTAFVFEWR